MDDLAESLAALSPELRGFGFEGAGMAFAVRDLMSLSRGSRLHALVTGPGARYIYLVHVGAGWAFARMKLRPWWTVRPPDPLLRWLAWDGYGFHQGFFHADRVVGERRLERGLTSHQRAIRDQGLGRSLWFHECADVDGVALRITEFEPYRRADLWSGVALAATYAGGATPGELERMIGHAGSGYRTDLAQGAAFASEARQLSGIVPDHTSAAAGVLTETSVEEAAGWTRTALGALGEKPQSSVDFQRWRAEVRRLWSAHHQRRHGSVVA